MSENGGGKKYRRNMKTWKRETAAGAAAGSGVCPNAARHRARWLKAQKLRFSTSNRVIFEGQFPVISRIFPGIPAFAGKIFLRDGGAARDAQQCDRDGRAPQTGIVRLRSDTLAFAHVRQLAGW